MNTRARIATICLAKRMTVSIEGMRERVLLLLSSAAQGGTDLVALPETCVTPAGGVPLAQLAETVPGPTIDAVSQIARRQKCYVICPLVTRRDGEFWNSAVVIGRSGEVVGIYDKLQPVTTTPDYTLMEQGTSPGRQLPVFDLDFGRIGIQICFDAGFPQNWQKLADQDVRAVFWCSAYNGGYPLQVYAGLHEYYVISSVRSDRARVIDPCAKVLAETDGIVDVIWQSVNLDFAVCHSDFNYALPDRIAQAYGPRVNVRGDGDAGTILIEPMDPAITIANLQQEFSFETRRQYFRRHESAYEQIRSGRPANPQVAAHGDRPMYTKW